MSAKALLSASVSAGPAVYVEDVFSTYLYTGNGSTQTITNGIDLAGEGGLVWGKRRNLGNSHFLIDTERGAGNRLESDGTGAQTDKSASFPSFNSDGFTVATADGEFNNSAGTYASWTFRKAPKFFDVVTWTGNGVPGREIPHNLGSVPGCIIVKQTNGARDWPVYHRGIDATNPSHYKIPLNKNEARANEANIWNDTEPTSTHFTVGSDGETGGDGNTYVAYLFAHNAGGFGDAGTDNVISCGSFTDTSTGGVVNLGYEPQFVLVKSVDNAGSWFMLDTMRGWINDAAVSASGQDKYLLPNSSGAEGNYQMGEPTATGFRFKDNASGTYIYIAIRRGPMRAPESGTEVFNTGSATSPEPRFKSNFPVDLGLFVDKGQEFLPILWADRLRGGKLLTSSSTDAETTGSISGQSYTGTLTEFDYQNGFYSSATGDAGQRHWSFRRAPGFFDVVAYTGNFTTANVINHNLGVAPELVMIKGRSELSSWLGGTQFGASNFRLLRLDSNAFLGGLLAYSDYSFFTTAPTETNVTTGQSSGTNAAGQTYIAYLFATLAGVSKVGSYTGTGTTLNVDCGFIAGARFVLIRRTDSGGDWYVWDTARGIIAGNDPYLLLNSTAAEVTNTDYIDPLSSGFQISSTAPAAINASGGTYIFLAIA
jgi:hypothetical protein